MANSIVSSGNFIYQVLSFANVETICQTRKTRRHFRSAGATKDSYNIIFHDISLI